METKLRQIFLKKLLKVNIIFPLVRALKKPITSRICQSVDSVITLSRRYSISTGDSTYYIGIRKQVFRALLLFLSVLMLIKNIFV